MKNKSIKTYEEEKYSDLFRQTPFDKWHAWMYLLLHAESEDKTKFVSNRKVDAKKGCVYISQDNLAKEWGWPKCKAIRFLAALQQQGMLTMEKSNNQLHRDNFLWKIPRGLTDRQIYRI